MNIHLLTVSRSGTSNAIRPRISFRGDWLPEIGFVPGALVQVLPELDGMVFKLCNSVENYSELLSSTRKMYGNLIHVYLSKAKNGEGPTFVTSGKYIYTSGLKIGDPLIAQYDYGIIRVRKIDPKKLGFQSVSIVQMTHVKDRFTGEPIPKVRLYGDWLNDIGFSIDSLALVGSQPESITFLLQDSNIEKYSALVKYARQNKMKLAQIRQEMGLPIICITGSIVERAGFTCSDILAAGYRLGKIQLQKLDFEKLDF